MALTRIETHARIAQITALARSGRMPADDARAAIARCHAHLSLLDLVGS